MYQGKNVLLIAGGGTLGTYTAEELLRLGCSVDVICLEDKESGHENLRFIKSYATEELLQKLFAEKHYHGIVNFIHYPDVEAYKPVHKLLAANTDHLIFLSSYRVYADLQHPVTESAPMLLDVIKDDQEFLEKEDYALVKAKAEKFLREESGTDNWTAVRPVISFSALRFDLVTRNGRDIIDAAASGTPFILPAGAKNLTAGLDWAGNSGKLIANLLWKPGTFRESYTVSSAQNLTWGQVADIYTELLGVKIEWMDTEEYLKERYTWHLVYDRLYDRAIDNSKILQATGLQKGDFKSVKEGLIIELQKVGIEAGI